MRELGEDGHLGPSRARRGSWQRRPARVFLGGASNRDLDRDINAMFAELSLPITDSFQAQLAARYEDYGGGIG